jgi:hypothetical protein
VRPPSWALSHIIQYLFHAPLDTRIRRSRDRQHSEQHECPPPATKLGLRPELDARDDSFRAHASTVRRHSTPEHHPQASSGGAARTLYVQRRPSAGRWPAGSTR